MSTTVRLLGPLEVVVDDRTVEVSGPLPRRLLALLALHAGSDVSAEVLADRLWNGRPPAGAAATLQSHVARLRRAVGRPGVVETRPGGYRLEATTDVAGFEGLMVDDPAAALAMWRGPALDGLRESDALAREAARLDELRVDAAQAWLGVALDTGPVPGAVAQLESLVAEHPTRESLWALLMRALYLDGRQAAALTAYQRARRALRDELGIDPGTALRDLEHRVLTQDPSLTPAAAAPSRSGHAQRRQVSVLVLEMADPDGDDEERMAAEVASTRSALHALVEAHGGRLLPSPGLALYVVFGAPVAHEDDARRALATARAALTRWPTVRAGVASGPSLVDGDGAPAPAGTVTRRAEQLCRHAAPGRAAADDATRMAAEAARADGLSAFVGREMDLEQLVRELDVARRTASPRLVTIIGEAGIGKTRTAREFLRGLSPEVVARSVTCPSYGEASGRAVIEDLVGAEDDEPDDAQSADRHDSFLRWQRLLHDAAGGRPLVVHVDDLQWADELLVDFVQDLVRRSSGRPLLVLVTARPELEGRHPLWGRGAPSATTFRLGPLSDDEAARLVGALVGPDAALRARLVEQAGGVPLHALELARMAGDTGPHPGTLPAVVAARIDTLSPAARGALLDASVVGAHFDPEVVAVLGGLSRTAARSAVDELVHRDFARRRPDGGLVFAHDVVRETAYASLVRAERARRHLAVVRWATSQHRDPSWLAHHALSAYDLARAVGDDALAEEARPFAHEHALAAGTSAFRLDIDTAMRLFQRAVDTAEPGSQGQARAQVSLGMAMGQGRRFAEAGPLLEQGLAAMAGVTDAIRPWGVTHLMLAKFATGAELAPLVPVMEEALRGVPPCPETVYSEAFLAIVELIKQTPAGFRRAADIAADIVERARRAGLGDHVGIALAVHARARLGLGDGAALAELRHAWDLSRLHANAMVAAGAGGYLPGALHHWAGPAEELAAREEVEAYAEDHGTSFETSFSVAERVRCLAELGRHHEAVALAETIDTAEAQPRWGIVQRALCLADLGELAEPDVAWVRRTPPASSDDLRHVLGSMLVEAAWAPGRTADLVAGLVHGQGGDLAAYADRDGALELLPRLVRAAHDAGIDELPLPRRTSVETPLAAAITPHVNGLLDRDPALLLEAAAAWEAMGHRVEAAFALLDAAEAGADTGPEAAARFTSMGLAPWAARVTAG